MSPRDPIRSLVFPAIGAMALLMGAFYLTCIAFIVVVLGTVLKVVTGLSILSLMKYLGREYLLIFATSSSETALPRLIAKMEHAGVDKSVVGVTVPTGYSFNLDGTAIYLTMAALFVSSAMGMPMDLGQQISLLVFMIIASKGAAGVTGAGLDRLEQFRGVVPAGGDVERGLPLREQPVRGGQRAQVQHVRGAFAKQREEVVERVRHEVPARAGVEAKAVDGLTARAAADRGQLLHHRRVHALAREQRGGGHAGDARADDHGGLRHRCPAIARAVSTSLRWFGTRMRVDASSAAGAASDRKSVV